MRFFAHDGKTVYGPSELDELLELPGFDGNTLVCPVGSEDSADWKPALAYPAFREALFAPAPKAAPLPPLPPPPTESCPRCAHANPQGARYCNACSARMDGQEPIPRAPEPAVSADESVPAAEATAPEPAAAAQTASVSKTLAGAFIGAMVASGTLGWWLLRPHAAPRPPVLVQPELPAEPAQAAPTVAAPSTTPVPPPVPAIAPSKQMASRATLKTTRPKAPAPKRATPVAKRAARKLSAKKPAPETGNNKENSGFLLPGVPRRVPPQSLTKSTTVATDAPAPGAAPENGAERQVRDQFEFCAQLLAQGAYGDHFDTCLCADARQAEPYLGHRDTYAAELKKAAAAGALDAGAPLAGIVIDGAAAKVTTNGKTAPGAPVRAETENWRLEDGLWCRAP